MQGLSVFALVGRSSWWNIQSCPWGWSPTPSIVDCLWGMPEAIELGTTILHSHGYTPSVDCVAWCMIWTLPKGSYSSLAEYWPNCHLPHYSEAVQYGWRSDTIDVGWVTNQVHPETVIWHCCMCLTLFVSVQPKLKVLYTENVWYCMHIGDMANV